MSTFVTLNSNDDKILATEFKNRGIGDSDPFSETRMVAFDDGRTLAGTVELNGRTDVAHFPHWELVIVTKGTIGFEFDTTRIRVSAGGCLVINKGSRFRMATDADAGWVFLAVATGFAENPEPAVLTFFDRKADLFPSASLDAEILLTQPPPICRNHRMHVRGDIAVRAGIWDSTPYERIVVEQREHELMHITRGQVAFSDGEGREELYSEGETFLVPKGVHGKWTSTVHVAKIYAVVS